MAWIVDPFHPFSVNNNFHEQFRGKNCIFIDPMRRLQFITFMNKLLGPAEGLGPMSHERSSPIRFVDLGPNLAILKHSGLKGLYFLGEFGRLTVTVSFRFDVLGSSGVFQTGNVDLKQKTTHNFTV